MRSSFGLELDRFLFGVLIALLLGFQLQFLIPALATLHVRECLIVYLYLRILFFYRNWFVRRVALLVLFLLACLVVGVQTLLVYGADMAIQGTLRFVSIAVLAPLASVFIRAPSELWSYYKVWITFVILAAISAVYQVFGGDLSWMVRDYVASRAGLMRYMTLLGEANVGGMAAALLAVAVATRIRSVPLKIGSAISCVILLVFSISKAAFLGVAIGAVVVLALKSVTTFGRVASGRETLWRSFSLRRVLPAVVVIVAIAVVFALSDTFSDITRRYASVVVPSLVGTSTNSKALSTDIEDRVYSRTADGIALARSRSSMYVLNVFLGSTFGIAGSAAVEIRGSGRAILPHNTFLELYLVGGGVLLALYLVIVAGTWRRLYRASTTADGLFAFTTFVVLTAYSAAYPVIYAPALGVPLWLIIGATSSRYFREAGLHESRSPVEAA